MDLETITLSEVSQRKTSITSLTCGIYTNDAKELIYKTEVDSQTERTERIYDNQRGKWWRDK